jgi:hypothetical protein
LGNPGYLAQQSDVTSLLGNIGNNNYNQTMDFYFDGHGNPIELGDGNNVSILQISVRSTLGNIANAKGPQWSRPCRLVFLNACDTAADDHWASAFGIPHRITTQDLTTGQFPQAFVGWVGKPRGATTDSDWNNLAQTYAVFWGAWMSELYTLDDALAVASQDPSLSFPFGQKFNVLQSVANNYPNNFHLRICGYAGITRMGYTPGDDSSAFYQ